MPQSMRLRDRQSRSVFDVDANVLYVDNGHVLTSAGAAAGFDLCLHKVRRDLGAEVAASVARLAVMPLERAGGQAQFIEHALPSDSPGAMTPLLTWMEQHLSCELPLQVIAVRATPGCARMCLHSVREENRAWSAGPLRQAGSGWPPPISMAAAAPRSKLRDPTSTVRPFAASSCAT
jgi:hypothetical protein